MRQVIIYPGEDGCWVAECPTLPGCISQGKTKEEASGISVRLSRDTSPHWRRMAYRFPRSGLNF